MKITKEFLVEEYKIKSVSQIAKENCIPNTCLYRLFDKYQIERRNQKEAGKLKIKNHCIDCGKKVSRKEYQRCRSCRNKQIHKDYVCIKCSNKISNSNGLYGKKQCPSCANKGSGNPFYNKEHTDEYKKTMSLFLGGTGIPYELSTYPIEFNQELKESIRKRDNYTCQNPECNMTEEEHLIVYGVALHVHHIDYNKDNCKKNNLITVCVSCNLRANYNRTYWQNLYSSFINFLYAVDLGEK